MVARRVLSIQSHVVHGCVGNRAAALPLQLLGIETDVLNTLQYSNHAGYGSFAGEKLTGDQLYALLDGMHRNGLLAASHVLTGYMGSAETIRAVLRALPLLRSARPDVQFWCDPVLGDNGRLYVPPALVDALVALSNALQRERTAIKLLNELLVEHIEDLKVGDVVGVGDLWDVLAGGEDTADAKIAHLKAAGITVADSPATIGAAMAKALGL
jgi:pyridoxine kinase